MLMKRSFFIQVFGDYPLTKVLDFLLTFREFDYSLTEIARNANVGWSTINKIIPKLVKIGIVKKTRKLGRATLYKLNMENPITRKLIDLDFRVSSTFVDKIVEREKLVRIKVK